MCCSGGKCPLPSPSAAQPDREMEMHAVLLWILLCIASAQLCAQEPSVVVTSRIVDELAVPVVPLRDSTAFQAAIAAGDQPAMDRHIRHLVRDNGRARKVTTAHGERWVTGLSGLPPHLMAQPGVRRCLLLNGQLGELLLIVEFQVNGVRRDRIHTLHFTGRPPDESVVPNKGAKGRWKVLGVE